MTKNKKPDNCNIIIETFRKPNNYILVNLVSDEPSCFSSEVSFRKYRITVEEIDEPKEVLAERLQKLWDVCDNYHHVTPLKKAAKRSIDYELVGSLGFN